MLAKVVDWKEIQEVKTDRPWQLIWVSNEEDSFIKSAVGLLLCIITHFLNHTFKSVSHIQKESYFSIMYYLLSY